jgi:hypothetical protein
MRLASKPSRVLSRTWCPPWELSVGAPKLSSSAVVGCSVDAPKESGLTLCRECHWMYSSVPVQIEALFEHLLVIASI